MNTERIYKTIEKVSRKTGKTYRTTLREPAPKFRGQRFTLQKSGLATIRLWLTQEQYEFSAEATKDVARAWGVTGEISVPTAIVGAAQISLHVLHGGKFELPTAPTGRLSVSGVSGRPPAFRGGGANVVLTLERQTAKLLSDRYEQYCELTGVDQLPRTGPVWAAFEHGCNVIREALGEFLTVQEALAK